MSCGWQTARRSFQELPRGLNSPVKRGCGCVSVGRTRALHHTIYGAPLVIVLVAATPVSSSAQAGGTWARPGVHACQPTVHACQHGTEANTVFAWQPRPKHNVYGCYDSRQQRVNTVTSKQVRRFANDTLHFWWSC